MTSDEVRAILAKTLGKDVNIDEVVRGKDEAWDSLASLGILFELEETFNVTFSDDEIGQLNSLAEIVKIIDARRVE
jgi:acyl carrier protein